MIAGLVLTILLCCWFAALVWNRRKVQVLHGGGDPARGIVVFVEPVRWLFIVWGFTAFCRGLRRAGSEQAIHLFRWSSAAGALLVIPDLVRRRKLDHHADRLARFIDRLAATRPGVDIHVVGYSTGAYVASEACKRLDKQPFLASLTLLAPSASPQYDWGFLRHGRLRVHSFYSPLDAINIVGPVLFGGNDRKWMPAAGAVGFTNTPAMLVQRCWRVSDSTLGYFGDHFTIASPAFIARHVAPIIMGNGLLSGQSRRQASSPNSL